MSNPMTQLVLDLIKNITSVSKTDGVEFSSSIKDSFESCSTFESYLTGIAEKQYVHCISQCLQQSAENATSPEIRPYLWNPIVASLLKCVGALAEREPRGSYLPKTPGKQSGSTRKPALNNRTPPRPVPDKGTKKKCVGNTQPKATSQSATDISAAVAKVSLEPKQTTGVPTPSASSAKVDPQLRLKVYSETRTAKEAARSPFFKQLKGGNHGEPVNCKLPGCATCEKFFSLAPLTRCEDIRCHRVGSCTPSGWYPHVLPHIWASIKKAHTDLNIEVKYFGLPENQLPPLMIPSVLEPLPKKRSWAQAVADVSDDSDYEVTSPKIMSPLWEAESWSTQVEAEEGNSGDVH